MPATKQLPPAVEQIMSDNSSCRPYDAGDLRELNAAELRTLARQQCRNEEKSRTWVNEANRETIEAFLTSTNGHFTPEETPQSEPTAEQSAENSKPETQQQQQPPKAEQPADALSQFMGQLADTAVKEAISNHKQEIQRPVFQINLPSGGSKTMEERTHQKFEEVLFEASLGLPVLLVGNTGTGKTHLAGQVAKALDLPFTFNSMSEGISEHHLLGRTLPDENGRWTYQPSDFVQTYQNGGVHLLDEIDSADANLMTHINSALANGHLSLPFQEGVIEKSENCVIIAAANTYGTGANRQFAGRNALDGATLDRFQMSTVEVDYDTALEREIAESYLSQHLAQQLLQWAWKVRENIREAGLRRAMSTRTIANSAIQMSAGRSFEKCVEKYFNGWSDSEKRRVE